MIEKSSVVIMSRYVVYVCKQGFALCLKASQTDGPFIFACGPSKAADPPVSDCIRPLRLQSDVATLYITCDHRFSPGSAHLNGPSVATQVPDVSIGPAAGFTEEGQSTINSGRGLQIEGCRSRACISDTTLPYHSRVNIMCAAK